MIFLFYFLRMQRRKLTRFVCELFRILRIYKVPGAGSRLIDEADWLWPGNGATCTAPLLIAV